MEVQDKKVMMDQWDRRVARDNVVDQEDQYVPIK